jgi:hypothetical protein
MSHCTLVVVITVVTSVLLLLDIGNVDVDVAVVDADDAAVAVEVLRLLYRSLYDAGTSNRGHSVHRFECQH